MNEFAPGWWIRHPHMQSVLASSPVRRHLVERRQPRLLTLAESVELNGGTDEFGDTVRLVGCVSRQPEHSAPPLAILLHGWEGSARSTYLLDLGDQLFESGFDVLRLNFRDHGETHALNQGIFHSCRLDEVVLAVADAASRFGRGPVTLAGYSLGGNFALRVARELSASSTDLAQVCAVSPVINPAHGLAAIERYPRTYEAYFLRKWRRSLRAKAAHFVGQYDFEDKLDQMRLIDLTDWLVRKYTHFESVEDYFDGYSIADDRLQSIKFPTLIVTALDDPIIPAHDFHQLKLSMSMSMNILNAGGHCGFVEQINGPSWIAQHLAHVMRRAVGMTDQPSTWQMTAETGKESC